MHKLVLCACKCFTTENKVDICRGFARGGHGVIGPHFAKITPNFGFLVAIGGHS